MGLFDLFASKTKEIPRELTLDAELDIKAAASEGEAPTFTLVANTGVPMDVDGFLDPVVIDLTGARFAKKKTPVIMDHDTSKRIGFTTEQTVEANRITASGKAVSSMGVAQGFVEDAKAGFPFQVSVGASVLDAEFIPEGEKTTVNGKSVRGPVIVARKTLIRELSVTVLGADGNTSAKVAARYQNTSKGDASMDFNAWLTAKGFDAEKLSEEQTASLKAMYEAEAKTKKEPKTPAADPKTVQATDGDDDKKKLEARRKTEADETARVDGIKALFARYDGVEKLTVGGKEITAGQYKRDAIADGLDIRDVELNLMRADRPAPTPAIHSTPDIEGEVYGEALACSLARSFGMKASFKGADGGEYGYEKQFSEEALNAADDRRLRSVSLHMLMDIGIAAANGTPFSGNRKSDDFIRAYFNASRKIEASGPFSTLTVTNILENLANKFLLARFQMQRTTWQQIARTRPLDDFKPASLYRLSENLGYLKVGPSGELKHGEISDSKRTVQAETFGRLIALTRVHIRNDDLNAFRQILIGLSEGSAWAIEAETWGQLLSQITGGAFFTAALGNLISDDLGIAGVTNAEQKYMDRVSTEGKPIMVAPDRLIVGTQDSVLADQINNDVTVVSTTIAGGFESNPHAGKYGKVASPYLSNTAIKKPDGTALTGQDSDQWLLVGNPDLAAVVEVGLLDGRVLPFIEQGESSFDTLGIQWRGYHDFGVAAGDEEAGVLSLGDDSSV